VLSRIGRDFHGICLLEQLLLGAQRALSERQNITVFTSMFAMYFF
jgi:hypothetical protein